MIEAKQATEYIANNPQKKANQFVKNARIKPSKDATVTNMTLTKQGNPLPTKNLSYDKKDKKHTNDWGADYVSESKDMHKHKTINCNKNMNKNSKNVVRLTESKLRNMIKECIANALKEEIDTGQVPSAQDRVKNHSAKSDEIRRQISQLRKKIWNSENEEEAEKYKQKINKLKKML